jgi:hypothetical protein
VYQVQFFFGGGVEVELQGSGPRDQGRGFNVEGLGCRV